MQFPGLDMKLDPAAAIGALFLFLVSFATLRMLIRSLRAKSRLSGRLDAVAKNAADEEEKKKKKNSVPEPEINDILGYDFVRRIDVAANERHPKESVRKEFIDTSVPGWNTVVAVPVSAESEEDRRRKELESEDAGIEGLSGPKATKAETDPGSEPTTKSKKDEPVMQSEESPFPEGDETDRWAAECFAADMEEAWAKESELRAAAEEYFAGRKQTTKEKDDEQSEEKINRKNTAREMLKKWNSNEKAKEEAREFSYSATNDKK